LLDRPNAGEKAILVQNHLPGHMDDDSLQEFTDLARSAGAEVVGVIESAKASPDPKYYVGSGKVDEIKALAGTLSADIILFNHQLTPGQERNLEQALHCRVLDRTGLILDIFAQRARTFEGKLQVELAQLRHLSTRLVRGWTHLERQKGGIGLRGPGETQLETDRRLIRTRIKYITERLEKVRLQREQNRRTRTRSAAPIIALVGYTNAGKSTLFNTLTGADVFVENQLFATLDPTLRHKELPGIGRCIFVDTVGFVRDLPHTLVEAFRATLEETQLADLLLHIVDASDELRQDKITEVNDVLAQIGAGDKPQILVYNKIDKLDETDGLLPRIEETGDHLQRVWLSATTGVGLPELNEAISRHMEADIVHTTLHLPPVAGRFRAALHDMQAVVEETNLPTGDIAISICSRRDALDKLGQKLGVDWEAYIPDHH